MNEIERVELARHEDVIRRGIGTFVEVGQALLAIRDQRLYRAEFTSFDAYCRDRWGFQKPRATQLIQAAQISQSLVTSGNPSPTSEREVRPLVGLAPDAQREAWQRAVETAPDGKITAGHVQRVVDEMTRPAPEPEPEPDESPEDFEIDEYGEVLTVPPVQDSEPEPARLAVHFSSATPEHYTPREIIDATLTCLGEIDLDPCSNSHESPNVPAATHYTINDDGLAQRWHGRVYMNPPYGRDIAAWVEKLDGEARAGRVTEAVALVPARTDTQWWQTLRDYTVCFITGRLRFVGEGNDDVAPFPSAVFYLGPNIDHFYYAFRDLGDIYQRIEPDMFASD